MNRVLFLSAALALSIGCDESPATAPTDTTLSGDSGALYGDLGLQPKADGGLPTTDLGLQPTTDASPAPDAADPWPAPENQEGPGLSWVLNGATMGAHAAISVTTPPAGYRARKILTFTLTNRSAQPIVFEAGPWVSGEGALVGEPPESLDPETSVEVVVAIDVSEWSFGGQAVVTFGAPQWPTSQLELHLDVPPPLKIVVVGDGNITLVSDDYGATFTEYNQPETVATSMEVVTWGEGVFLRSFADGLGWGDPGAYEYSVDGIDWTRSESDGGWASQCAYGLGVFVCAVGDALAWSESGTSINHESTRWGSRVEAFAYGNGRFVAVGREGRYKVSADGKTWLAEGGVTERQLRGVAYAGDGRWVAVGGSVTLEVITSDDNGDSWQLTAVPDAYQGRSVACGPQRCIASVQHHRDSLLATDDAGHSWHALPQTDGNVMLLGYVNGWFFAARSGNITRSIDGESWQDVHTLSGDLDARTMAAQAWEPNDE